MAAQIRVLGQPLGVVLAGQWLPQDPSARRQLVSGVCQKHRMQAEELTQAFEADYQRHESQSRSPGGRESPNGWSNVCDDQQITLLLERLVQFAQLIEKICDPVAQTQVQVRRREFVGYWMRRLADARPGSMTAWQSAVRDCFASFVGFAGPPIERIGLFHGEGEAPTRYSLAAMNSSRWWDSVSFSLYDPDVDQPQQFAPKSLPPAIKDGVGMTFAESKHFFVCPSTQKGPKFSGEVHSLIVIQASSEIDASTLALCRDFCDDMSRRDAITRLFLSSNSAHETFAGQVTDIRHDLHTSLQHVVDNVQSYAEQVRSGVKPGSDEDREMKALLKMSIDDHCARVDQLKVPGLQHNPDHLVSMNLFDVLRGQVKLYTATAAKKNVGIHASEVPATKAYVVCEPSELARAIAALLDNAIKYSYRDGRKVIVFAEIRDEEARIVVENYGIGIPPDKLDQMNMRKFTRAEVRDRMVYRAGTGQGQRIATYVFVDLLRGSLVLESEPSDRTTPRTDFHRYVTRVIVRVPVHVEG